MLMGLVALIAVGLAATKVATEQSSRVVFGLGLLVLLVATLGAIVRRSGRARWVGLALFGWAYALVLLVPPFREAVAAELPGNGSLSDLVDLLRPPLSIPAEPPGKRPSSRLNKVDTSGWHFMEGGRIVDLSSEEWRPWATWLDRRNAYDARVEAAEGARRIALTFLGLAFAALGAAAGLVLEGPAQPAGASPVGPTPDLPD